MGGRTGGQRVDMGVIDIHTLDNIEIGFKVYDIQCDVFVSLYMLLCQKHCLKLTNFSAFIAKKPKSLHIYKYSVFD